MYYILLNSMKHDSYKEKDEAIEEAKKLSMKTKTDRVEVVKLVEDIGLLHTI